MLLKLVKSSGVQVLQFDMGFTKEQLPMVEAFQCTECKSVMPLSELRFSFRFIEGCTTAVYRIKTYCLGCREKEFN